MALSTRERRQAASVIGLQIAPSPTPNAAKDAEWRGEVAWSYPGIIAGAFIPQAGEMNESLREYLNVLYGTDNLDLTPLLDRYLDADTIIDDNVSLRELKVATDVENR